MKYDYTVFLGRFQPLHSGHLEVIKAALEQSKKLIIVIGSANTARTTRNPLTVEERINLFKVSLSEEYLERILFIPQVDYAYNDTKWIKSIQQKVKEITNNNQNIALVGHKKDHTSYYLEIFPSWDNIPVENHKKQNSTNIRQMFFDNYPTKGEWIINDLHLMELNRLFDLPEVKKVKEEYEFIKKYKQQWENSPYEPTFVTVDALVEQSGHILLVERKSMPGRGLYALPGGFLDRNERIKDACIRELLEETKIGVSKNILEGRIEKSMVFDSVERSQRGRTITHCYLIRLKRSTKLEKVRGSSDAKRAFWFPIGELEKNRDKFFEDHFDIIETMLEL